MEKSGTTAKDFTWYVRDAQGNLITTYTASGSVDTSTLENLVVSMADRMIYGSSRLGMYSFGGGVDNGPTSRQFYSGGTFLRGWRQYELANHLGNVLTTISDRKTGVSSGGIGSLIDYYEPDIVSANDYYPFGMTSRVGLSTKGVHYRYGFNGKENDWEAKGWQNQQDYGMRIYDPRLGRFLSVDPITKEYPELTPYQFASNRPIDGIDLDGLEHTPASIKDGVARRDQTAVNTKPVLSFKPRSYSAHDPNVKSWKARWRDSDNILANISYDIANGLYTLPQQLTASIRNEDYIYNIGGNVHRAHGIGGEKERVKNFINGATALVPGAATEGVIGKYADDVITKIEKQVTQQVTERGLLLKELVDQGIKHTPDQILHIGRNASGKVIFMETGNANAGLAHIMKHADEFAKVGIEKADIGEVVFEAVTKGTRVGFQGAGTGRPIYQIMYNGEAKNIAVTVGDNGFIVGANPTTKL